MTLLFIYFIFISLCVDRSPCIPLLYMGESPRHSHKKIKTKRSSATNQDGDSYALPLEREQVLRTQPQHTEVQMEIQLLKAEVERAWRWSCKLFVRT